MSQTLAKTQAARETEKVKEKIRLKKIKEDKEKSDPGEVIQPFGENMDKIKESRSKGTNMKNLKKSIEFLETIDLKSGGQIKCGVQMKGTSPLIEKREGK